MWILYQLLVALAMLLAGPLLLLRRGGHYLSSLAGRLGRYRGPVPDRPVWLHAVSVGEVGVAATLAGALPSDLPLLVTTVTPTGQERAHETLAGRGAIAYLPFELDWVVRRFYRRFSPRALILVEGDLWPLVLRQARRRGIPVVVVNGRVGDRSYRRMRRLRPLLGPLLGGVERFGTQTDADRRRLLDLGVAPERIVVTGNLKFESPAPSDSPGLLEEIEAVAAGRPILVAGSTMAGEEERVLDAWAALGGGERAMLILAPRHPERWSDVERATTGRGLEMLRRTRMTGADRPGVLLLDTLGELASVYSVGAAAFIGGTLVPTGGHNPLEPARFAIPTAVGPSMENFREIAAIFDRDGAWARVSDADELARVWGLWLDDPAAAARVGGSARALLRSNQGALERTLELIEPLLPAAESRP